MMNIENEHNTKNTIGSTSIEPQYCNSSRLLLRQNKRSKVATCPNNHWGITTKANERQHLH